MAALRYEIAPLALKKYFTSERNERVKYFSTLKRNFVSPRGHVISSICIIPSKYKLPKLVTQTTVR